MPNPYIKVRDGKDTVVSVTSSDPGPEANHTVYQEAWNGPSNWNSDTQECKRNGVDNYIVKKKAKKKRKGKKKISFAKNFIDEFLGTNLENFDTGAWTQAHLDAIRDDADIQSIIEDSHMGRLEKMKATIDAKAVINPWFKQKRKDDLSALLQEGILQAAEL